MHRPEPPPRNLALAALALLVGGCLYDMDEVARPCGASGKCLGAGQICVNQRCITPEAGLPDINKSPEAGPDAQKDAPGLDRQPDVGGDLSGEGVVKPDGTITPDTAVKPDLPAADLPAADLPAADLPGADLASPDQSAPDVSVKPDLPATSPDSLLPDLLEPDAVPGCGNGVVAGSEECDKTQLAAWDAGTPTCKLMGFYGGTIGCHTKSCTLNTSGCHDCGNNVKDSPEQCDGNDLDKKECTDKGHQGGKLACTNKCTFNLMACYSVQSTTPLDIAVDAGDETNPAVACGTTSCLVVWERGGYIRGRHVNLTGSLSATKEFSITTATSAQTNPKLAYDGASYRVLWEDRRVTTPHIYGVMVSPGKTSGFAVKQLTTGGSGQTAPAVACTSSTCLAVWIENKVSLHVSLMDAAGNTASKSGTLVSHSGTGQQPKVYPSVTAGDDFLVAWGDLPSNVNLKPVELYYRMVDSTTGAAKPQTPYKLWGALGTKGQFYTRATFSKTHFVVLHEEPGTGQAGLHAVLKDGTYASTTKFGASVTRPAGASFDTYTMVAWSKGDAIEGMLSMFGTDLSGTATIAAKATGVTRSAPAVAAIGAQFLVVWQNEKGANKDILGTWVKFN